ncbi:hypothetical protein G7046_g3621 [Stylonectria norvegica]|nr:hypothetical protein G7046_g3621 [Stylonectria norvegica]
MIRRQWLSHAAALPAARRAYLNSSALPESQRSTLPVRRLEDHPLGGQDTSSEVSSAEDEKPAATSLLLTGLHPSLKTTDFARIAAKDLTDWRSAILFADQERDPWTLDPLGNYRLAFNSEAAATAFRDKITRLMKLSQHKAHTPSGLWASTVPEVLQGPRNVEEQVDSYTIAPGSNAVAFEISRPLIPQPWAWQQRIADLVEEAGYKGDTSVVLVELPNSALSAYDLNLFIQKDGTARRQPWSLSAPLPLQQPFEQPPDLGTRVPLTKNPEFRAKVQSRFVLFSNNDVDAWRFIRSWNQRVLQTGSDGYTKRTLVKASQIEWNATF